MNLNSHQVALIRNALYRDAAHMYDLEQSSPVLANREKHNARAEELYNLAEQLKEVKQLESK